MTLVIQALKSEVRVSFVKWWKMNISSWQWTTLRSCLDERKLL